MGTPIYGKLVGSFCFSEKHLMPIAQATAANSAVISIAAENLVPYSKNFPSIFKRDQLTPVKDLKLLIKDYAVCEKPARPHSKAEWRY